MIKRIALGDLCKRLTELEALGLWHEPIDSDGVLTQFFSNVKELLRDKIQEASTPNPSDAGVSEDLSKMLSNAIVSIFGISVLSGSFENIITALEILHGFEVAAPQYLSDYVFELSREQIKYYLHQIEKVANAS